jgi:flagellar biogenesis protein FliO
MLSNALEFQAIQRRVVLLIVAIIWLIVGCGWAIRRVSDRYSYQQTQQLKKYHRQIEVWHENKESHENQR